MFGVLLVYYGYSRSSSERLILMYPFVVLMYLSLLPLFYSPVPGGPCIKVKPAVSSAVRIANSWDGLFRSLRTAS